ncbi:hypothetical protein GH865_08485 [Rhodocyclus tenuis]|uniref:phage tail protein n=1 Tax=Rhodocyclus gracilis TaxID=2929842 RepID=UPI001298BAF0|nr:tail fiber protein [Rhodocyclus gracilis]MRD73285.1 hypothetical protein [Rhodocyclus gracilis]
MKRIDGAGHVSGMFVAEDAGASRPPTEITAEWLNGVQEELLGVIEGVGDAPSGGDNGQLRRAIAKMIQSGQRSVIINNATFAAAVTGTGKAVYWDAGNSRFDLALADGTAKQSCVGFADVAKGNVYAFGDAVLFTGLTPGARYYLDGATAGAITTTAPSNAVFVGIARNATELFVDVDAASGAGVPVGTVIYVARNAAPTGYLKANGALLSRTTYSELFGAIGTTYGAGDGSTTFNLPDLRGEFIRGWDDSRGVDSARVLGSAQSSQVMSHTHGYGRGWGNSAMAHGASASDLTTLGLAEAGAGSGVANDRTEANSFIRPSGGAEGRPRNVALLACIKY